MPHKRRYARLTKQGLVLMLIGQGLFLGVSAALGDMARTRQEIAHLMDYIAASDCRFIRNGQAHDAQAAREHIQKKYDYLQSRIHTAEDFILHAASASSMSGKPYRIACGDRAVLCADWLRDELERFRRQTGTARESASPR